MKKHYRLRILQTSDIHGYIYPHQYSTMKEMKMGIAKLSRLIEQYRDDNTLLIDTGDTIQGSPLLYVHSTHAKNKINPMAHVMNYLQYDYVSIGNHEFNYGIPFLNNYLHHLDAPILNANILDLENKPLYGKPYDIITLDNGIKVAIIGVTTHYIPNWEQPSHIEGIQFMDAFETTKKVVSNLQGTVDLIVVNYHAGFESDLETGELVVKDTGENQGYKMMREIDGIDVLLTGHQHRKEAGTAHNTTYLQPGFNAGSLGFIDIEFEYEDKWVVTNKHAKILSLTDEVPNLEILALVEEHEALTQSVLDTPVGYLEHDLLITNQLEARLDKHPLVSFINQVQLAYSKADISSCSLGNSVSGFKKIITIRDIIGTYMFPNTLVIKEVLGKDLLEALEKTATFFDVENDEIVIAKEFNDPKMQLYAYDMYDNMSYTITVSKPKGQRISNVTVKGKPLDLETSYSLAMNNYRAAGGGDYFMFQRSKTIHDTQKEVIELLIDYITEKKHITIAHTNNITIRK